MFESGIKLTLSHINRMGNDVANVLARMGLTGMNFIEFI